MDIRQHCYLAVDAGGSKTTALVSDHEGVIVGQGESIGANPHNMAYQVAWQHITEAVNAAKRNIPQIDERLSVGCLGLAGLDTDKDKFALQEFLKTQSLFDQTLGTNQLLVVNDAYAGLRSGTQAPDAVSVIAGTGSHVFGVVAQGQVASAGCWGYVLGDQGSGFAFGQQILKRVMAEYDGRQESSLLTRAVLTQLQLDSVEEMMSWTYQGPLPVKAIASLSQLCQRSDLVASLQPFIDQTVTELVIAYQAVVKRLNLGAATQLPVVLVGGLFEIDIITQSFQEAVLRITPQVNWIKPNQPPVYGALALAQQLQTALVPQTAFLISR